MTTTNSSRRVDEIAAATVERSEAERLLIGEIFEALAQAQSLRATLEAITTAVCVRLGVHSCAILLERSGADLLLIEGATGLSPGYVEAVNSRFPIHIEELGLSESPSSQAFRTGRVVIIEDTETDVDFRRWRSLARQQGYRSLVSVPLRWRDHSTGVLCCYQGEPRRFHDDEVHTLTIAATQIGVAIQIARLMDNQQQTINQLEELMRELNEQRLLLERSAEVHSKLTQLVLNNQGVPLIAATLARVVSSPVFVQDQFYRILAAVTAEGDQTTDLHPLTREVLALSSRSLRGAETGSPFEIPVTTKNRLDFPRAVAPIIAGRNLLGYVSLVVPELPTAPLHLRALEQAATVLALEMVKERLAHEVELRVRGGFADDLVAGRYDDVAQMRDRARYLGYDLSGPFQVLVVDIDQFDQYVADQRLSEADIDALRRRFSEVLTNLARADVPDFVVSGHHDRMALILSRVGESASPEPGQLEATIRSRLEQTLSDFTMSIGVGQVYPDLDQVRTSYQEAGQALHVLHRLGGRGKTLKYADLGVTRLLLQVENPGELIRFARSRLHPLLLYDERHEGVLIDALEAFLGRNLSVTEAARKLDLPPNTLRYRLRKIEELLGASLGDTTLLLDLQLACLIIRLVGLPDA